MTLVKVKFKDVGQGDAILIEWMNEGELCYGIVDCCISKGSNPLLEEIIKLKIMKFHFMILSHLHFDHYSGFGNLLAYCNEKQIKIDYFLHTFTVSLIAIIDKMDLSMAKRNVTDMFLTSLQYAVENNTIIEIDEVSNNFRSLQLTKSVQLKFHAPYGKDSLTLAHQISDYNNGRSKHFPNMNLKSTIIEILSEKNSILITSDATKKAFKRIKAEIANEILLAQAPHHGSKANLVKDFWKHLSKKENAPIVFSVGENKKYKLPDAEVVAYFKEQNYDVYSTNYVYGIRDNFKDSNSPIVTKNEKSVALSHFSKQRKSDTDFIITGSRFQGDQEFEIAI